METLTNEQAIAELRKRGVTDTEINFHTEDNKYNRLKSFLAENAGLQGEEDYQKAVEEFKKVGASRAKLFADMEAQAVDDPSMQAKLGALGRGFFQGPAQLADAVLALPIAGVDATLKTVLPESLYPDSASPYNLSRALQEVGLGYYDAASVAGRLPENVASDQRAKSPFTNRPYSTLRDMPASTRPFAVAGEEAGLSMSMSAPIAMAAKGKTAVQLATPGSGKLVGGTIDEMVKFAAKNPGTFASLEGSLAVLSGLGGGVAEAVAPGDPTARMIGSVGAPLSVMSAPLLAGKSYQIINGMSRGHIEKFKRALGMKLSGRRGAEKETAKLLQGEVVNLGGDPKQAAETLQKVLNEKSFNYKKRQSPGLLTGDQALLAIERSLIRSDKEISKEAAEQTKNSIIDMNRFFRNSIEVADGDPELLRIIAQARIDQLNAVTGLRVSEAVRKLQNMEANLTSLGTPNPQVTKEQAGNQLKAIFDKTYDDLRKSESALWDRVDKTLRISGTETDSALQKLASEEGGLLEIDLPNVLKRMQNLEFKPEAGISSVSSGDLLAARSQISEQIRKALTGPGSNQSRDLARRLKIIETGILNDLNTAGDSAALQLANNATRNKYEFLGIPIISKMYSRNIQGILEQQPDVVLDKALMGAGQAPYQDFKALLQAGAKGHYYQEMRDPLAKFYYAMANQAVSPTGEVDLTKLSGFLTKHENGLKTLGIYDSLQKPEIQAHLVKRLQNSTAQMQTSFLPKTMASRVLQIPASGMPRFTANILKSPNRYAELRRIRNLSLKKQKGVNNQEALNGVRSSIVENLLKDSMVPYSASGVADEAAELLLGQKLRQLLDVKQGKTTLREDLVNSGLFTKDEMAGIDAMSKEADKFAASVAQRTEGATLPSVPPDSDFLVDIFARLAGSSVALMSPFGQSMGHDLIIAQIGSKAGKNLLDKMPNLKLKEILLEAMQDPVLMKRLLEKEVGPGLTKSRNLGLGALLSFKGIVGDDEVYAIEDNDGMTETLQNMIGTLAREGSSAADIMEKFEVEARREGTSIGPYKLDQVQALLGMSYEDRAQVARKVNVRNVPKGRRRAAYYLSRKPRN